MKFLSSSSSSTTFSASSTAASSGGVHTPKNASPGGCIAGMFRRLLCSNSLPTHPADHTTSVSPQYSSDHGKAINSQNGKKIESLASTGVVARLMGLESMPKIELNPKSIVRSQSMNSMDSLRELKSIKQGNRRACSFREIPTYFELEDDNFFILSFDNEKQSKEFGSKQRKTETSFDEKQRRKAERMKTSCRRKESVYQKNKENQEINNGNLGILIPHKDSGIIDGKLRDSTNTLGSRSRKEVIKKKDDYKQERFNKKKKERKDSCLDGKKIETDCDSENSSPNSVLDFVEFPAVKAIPSSEKFSKLASSKIRRTLSEELENYRKLKLVSEDFQPKRSENVCAETRKNWGKDENYVKVWGEICKLAGMETVQNNDWQKKEIWKHEICQEIIGNFELEILDELVGELVNQLDFDSHTTLVCNSA